MWKYVIKSGAMYSPDKTVAAWGYAGGNCGKNKEGINNPLMCSVKDIGPLPPGLYTMGTPVEHSRLGVFAIPLIPDPSNIMMGRGGFYCHGDTTPSGNASEGCIIMPHSVRVKMWESKEKIQVVAEE